MKKIFAIAVLFGFYAATPGLAYAKCDGCVVSAVNSAQSAIVAAVSRVQAAVLGVTAAVNTNTTSVVSAISNSTQAIASQTARSAEMAAQSAQRTATSMEQDRQEDRYKVSDGCTVLASTRGMAEGGRSGGLGGGVGRGGGNRGSSEPTGVSRDMRRAIRVATGAEPAPTPEVQAALAVPGACSTFVSASANAVRAETCSAAGFSPGNVNGHPDADIRAETLFDGPQRGASASEFRRRLTIDADGAEASALAAYMRNLNTPVDLRQLRKGELQTDAGRQYLLYRDAYEARMSLAEKPVRSLANNRFANKVLIPVVEQLMKSETTGKFVVDYLARNYPKWKTNGLSNDELVNLEAERRYFNRDWHILMASMPPEVHVKEQTAILAYQTVLMTRMLERLDQQAVIAGQSVASQVRQEMMPQLVELHSAAAK